MTRHYYLEGYTEGTHHPRRYDLKNLPALVGRHSECAVHLPVERISRQHARFDLVDGNLTLTDLGSTNGTFVNRQRIEQPTPLAPGYVVHFADHEFRLMEEDSGTGAGTHKATMVGINQLPEQFPLQAQEFFELLRNRQVRGFRQLITRSDGSPYAYELLGRGAHPALGESPGALFNLAEKLNLAVKLSQLFRQQCFEDAHRAGLSMPLFFNTHPEESRNFDLLLAELQRLRKLYPNLNLVFEVHEAAISDLAAMAEVRRQLDKLGIGLAYDDFGAGQARLQELIEVPPDYLKFDIALVRNLEQSDSPRYQMLSSLNTLISGLGIQTLAEGIETERTATLCRDIGIDFFQGFLFARPEPILP